MESDQNDFQELRRIIALKRFEQPPPGYFNNFSSRVITRIESGEAHNSRSWLERLVNGAPWFQRLVNGLELKPAFAGGLSFAVCGLIVAGVLLSDVETSATMGTIPGVLQSMNNMDGPSVFVQTASMPEYANTNGFLPTSLRENSLFYSEVSTSPLSPPRAYNLKFVR